MKSFSEYIKEAYNFRLGGSQQKGFEQTKVKTLAELEKGDICYVYSDYSTHCHEVYYRKVVPVEITEARIADWSENSIMEGIWGKTDNSRNITVCNQESISELECALKVFEYGYDRCKVISTDYDQIVKYLKENNKEFKI